jgi:hypothetical protein
MSKEIISYDVIVKQENIQYVDEIRELSEQYSPDDLSLLERATSESMAEEVNRKTVGDKLEITLNWADVCQKYIDLLEVDE